ARSSRARGAPMNHQVRPHLLIPGSDHLLPFDALRARSVPDALRTVAGFLLSWSSARARSPRASATLRCRSSVKAAPLRVAAARPSPGYALETPARRGRADAGKQPQIVPLIHRPTGARRTVLLGFHCPARGHRV